MAEPRSLGARLPMSITYAIPDLHGRLDLLESAIEEIVKHAGRKRATIVTMGDYVDRGPNGRQVIERLRDWRPEGPRLVNLRGNHEAMMWEACHDSSKLSRWIRNGGDRTLASYNPSLQPNPDPGVVPAA